MSHNWLDKTQRDSIGWYDDQNLSSFDGQCQRTSTVPNVVNLSYPTLHTNDREKAVHRLRIAGEALKENSADNHASITPRKEKKRHKSRIDGYEKLTRQAMLDNNAIRTSQALANLKIVPLSTEMSAPCCFMYPSATTTPAGPYSASTDILTPYHSTDNTPRFPSPDDLRVGNGTLAELDRRRNHRPLSRKDSRKSLTITSKEKALSLEREKEQQTQNAGPVSDDLVAMGTNWNPHGMHLRSGAGGSRERPGSFGPASNHHISVSHISPQLSVTQAPTVMGPRRVGKTSSLSHFTGASHRTREVEPKYPDPMHVAPPSFQQRISELATLESETIRWERTRRIKKKPKDS